jgi:hypothetical protein
MRMAGMKAAALVVLSVVLVPATARSAAGQVEIERVLRRFDGVVITQLDVRLARRLELVAPEATSDDLVLRELENRYLILNEVSLFPPAEPDPLDVARRRTDWASRVGAGTDLPGRLVEAGLTPEGLDAWFRDDLRIVAYIDLRFGAMPEDERPAEIDDWIARLRQRAGLR